MKYNLLGRTGLYVSELCLGTMTFGGRGKIWENIASLDQKGATEIVKKAFDAGVNFIDTADVYSIGLAEEMTGEAIKSLGLPRQELIIATKAFGPMNDTPNGRGLSRYHLMNALDDSLKRLKVDHIDLYQVHGFDPLTPLEETLDALDDMVRSGKVRYIGLCNYAAWQVMKAIGISREKNLARFESIQAYYTLAGRDLEREIIPLAQSENLGIMVWSPLAGGLLSGKYKRDGSGSKDGRRVNFDFPVVDKDRAFDCIDVMEKVAKEHNATVAQIALAWLNHQKAVSSVIIGATKVHQLEDNLNSVKVKLTDKNMNDLNEVSKLPEEYPGWMFARQNYRADKPEKS